MNKKIKVVHYIPGFEIGGIESRLLDWYRNIDRSKIEFVVIRLNEKESDKAKEFIDLGGKFYNLPKLNLKSFFRFFKELKKVFEIEKTDIVHVHCLNSGIFCLMAAKKMKVKTRILHARTTDYLPNEKNKLIKTILKKITPYFATDYFACSYEAGLWGNGKKNADKTIVIKNGIELPLFNYNETTRKETRKKLGLENKIILGTIGRLSPQKNLLFLIELFNKISKNDADNKYCLVIIGDGDMYNKINEKILKLDLTNKVKIIESKFDVWNYYMAFDIFISTSFYEGFGTTAIEAQATGVPTILSTGFPESVVVSDYAKRISLDESIDNWIDLIIKTEARIRSKRDAENVEEKGYSAKAVAKGLEDFYCSKSTH